VYGYEISTASSLLLTLPIQLIMKYQPGKKQIDCILLEGKKKTAG
jgi:hypothetical protein